MTIRQAQGERDAGGAAPGGRHGARSANISTAGPIPPEADGRNIERADLLAWLRRRCDNADAIARRYPDCEPFAADRRRQLEVMIADIEAEMHLGAAQVEADRASGLRAAAGQIADQVPPTAYLGRYPNHEHRSLAEVAEDEGGAA